VTMPRRYNVISADGHLETPPDAWLRHVPGTYRELAPRLINLPEGGEAWVVEGLPLIHNGQNLAAGRTVKLRGASYWSADGSPGPGTGDARQRLREQDSTLEPQLMSSSGRMRHAAIGSASSKAISMRTPWRRRSDDSMSCSVPASSTTCRIRY